MQNYRVLIKKLLQTKTKLLLIKNELKKLKTFDSIYFRGKSHFEDDGAQNWLVFQPIQRYFKTVSANDSNILSWKSKGLSDESIKAPTTSNKILNPSLDYVGTKIRVKFSRDCLKRGNYIQPWENSKHLHCLSNRKKF